MAEPSTSNSPAIATTSAVETSEPSSSSSSLTMEVRPQAGPLPSKRGEIGFNEELHGQAVITRPEPVAALPERHPADRDAPPRPSNDSSATIPPASTSTGPSEASASTASLVKRKRKLGAFCLKDKKIPSYGGILLTTLLVFIVQCLVLCGTIAAWALTVQIISKNSKNDNSDSPDPGPTNSSAIFIHVVFGIAVLGQLLFLERKLFRLRAERYAFKHPGQILPTSRHLGGRDLDPNIAFSPWNRPPLPTYAAALAQSGVGTGDVEDHIIAQPPPPAYGNTRGSVMLLSGFLRNSLRAQRPVSERSERSVMSEVQRDRPVSYQSTDEQWQEIQDAERARRLEETLATLERPASRTN